MNGDGKFEIGIDLVAGRWSELWLDLRNVNHNEHSDPGDSRQVYLFHMHTNSPLSSGDPDVEFLWDHVFVTDEAFKTYYYHNDYLPSCLP